MSERINVSNEQVETNPLIIMLAINLNVKDIRLLHKILTKSRLNSLNSDLWTLKNLLDATETAYNLRNAKADNQLED